MRYDTTELMENPTYVQFVSYWNEIFITGIVPFGVLTYLNIMIFKTIKTSSRFRSSFHYFSKRLRNNTDNNSGQRSTCSTCRGSNMSALNETAGNQRNEVARSPTESNSTGLPAGTLAVPASVGQASQDSSPAAQPVQDQVKVDHQGLRNHVDRARREKERSCILVACIAIIFLICNMFRLVLKGYELANPNKTVIEHYLMCNAQGKYHVPVILYILANAHHLSLTINSSINLLVYCCTGKEFRTQLKQLFTRQNN